MRIQKSVLALASADLRQFSHAHAELSQSLWDRIWKPRDPSRMNMQWRSHEVQKAKEVNRFNSSTLPAAKSFRK